MANTALISILLCILSHDIIAGDELKTMKLWSISTISNYTNEDLSSTGQAVKMGHDQAIQDINAIHKHTLLPDYKLELLTLPADGSGLQAMEFAIFESIQSICKDESSIASPIFLGCPWSSLSVLTSMVFNIFNLLQISSSATSPTLSKADFKSFFRTIATDALQARALVWLCHHFKWERIGVIYIDDAYGSGLNNAIIDEASQYGIDVKSKAYDEFSMDNAAAFIRDNELYITILIIFDIHSSQFFKTLDSYGLTQFPYFYIGTDAWFIEKEIQKNNLTQYANGSIGTVPGNLFALDRTQYKEFNIYDGNMTIYNKSREIIQRMMDEYGESVFHTMMSYGYDSMFALAMALDKYIKNNSYEMVFKDCGNSISLNELQKILEPVQNDIREILINEVQFIGATGNVSFRDSGDREGGFFLFEYVTANGSVAVFGGFCDDHNFIQNHSYWPPGFDHIPKSEYVHSNAWNQSLVTLIVITCVVTILIHVSIILTCFCRNKKRFEANTTGIQLNATQHNNEEKIDNSGIEIIAHKPTRLELKIDEIDFENDNFPQKTQRRDAYAYLPWVTPKSRPIQPKYEQVIPECTRAEIENISEEKKEEIVEKSNSDNNYEEQIHHILSMGFNQSQRLSNDKITKLMMKLLQQMMDNNSSNGSSTIRSLTAFENSHLSSTDLKK